MQDQIDFQRIRRSFSLADEVSRWVALKKVGTRYVAKCPFHSERQPSFTVYETRGRFYCYGCGARGDIIDFVRRTQPGLTTTDARAYARTRGWLPEPAELVGATPHPVGLAYLRARALR
jgi:DNA primase